MRKFLIYSFPVFISAYFLFFVCSSTKSKPAFDEQSAFEYLEKQCAFGPRNPNSQGHKKCMNFLTNELKKYTPDVTVQKFTHFDAKNRKTLYLANIIGTFTSANSGNPRKILCAHWDTRPRADRDKSPENRSKPIIGANAGASGIAVLLEIARIMHTSPPPVTIDIIFFDGEDYGEEGDFDEYFLGSRYFAQNPVYMGYECAILLDMIGDKNLNIQKEAFSQRFFPHIVQDIWERAHKLGIKSFQNSINGEILDDHRILAESGIPAIDIIDFDYPYWHTIEDTPDKCSPKSLKSVGDVIIDYIYN
ncbi:M28 family peptidase [bacterium]|nr:M28 family peptidase [bacterium]